ncbi:efflux transporter outer membrane subunit [soil metagenome]
MKSLFAISLALAAVAAQAQTISLDQALAAARGKRASVKAAHLKLEHAKLARKALGTQPGSSLSLGYSNDVRVGATDNDLVLTQPIDIFGRTKALRTTGDALVLEAEANLRQTELSLQNDVLTLYVEAAATTDRLQAANQAVEGAQRLLDAIRGLVDGGRLPGVQATRVEIEFQRAAAVAKNREAEVRAAQNRLAAAISQKDAAVQGFPAIPTPEVTDQQLESQRADLLLLSVEATAAKADEKVATTMRLPQLELQARRSPWQQPAVYGGRIQLSFPLFDFGRSRAEESSARKRAEAALRSLEDAENIARSEINAALIEIEGAQAQVAAIDQIVTKAQALVESTRTGLREGANTLIDVLDSARALREIQESLIEAKVTLATAQARYLRATGTLIEVTR